MARKKIRVLIADDEPDVVYVLRKHLIAEGFDVVTADDGREAWELIGKTFPDIIVLDINMPEMDGLSILRALRSAPQTGQWQKVIIVSAKDKLEDIRRGVELQADHYLTKPCSVEDVVKAVRLMADMRPLNLKW
jgi:CheY-like chemotaxis protein